MAKNLLSNMRRRRIYKFTLIFFCETPIFVEFLDLLVCFRKFYIFLKKILDEEKFFVDYLSNFRWQILRHV